MADKHHSNEGTAMDYAEHEKTFALFAGVIKWGIVGTILFLLLVGAMTNLVPWAFAIIVSALTVGVIAKYF